MISLWRLRRPVATHVEWWEPYWEERGEGGRREKLRVARSNVIAVTPTMRLVGSASGGRHGDKQQ